MHQITEKHHKSNKKNAPILAMNNNARITSGTVAILDKPGWYRACIVGALTAGAVKQPDVRLIINGKSVGGPPSNVHSNLLPAHYKYGNRCTGWTAHGESGRAAAKVRINNHTGKTLYVGFVIIQKL